MYQTQYSQGSNPLDPFDPFEPRHLVDEDNETEEEEDVVAETQEVPAEAEEEAVLEIPTRPSSKRADRKNWEAEEEEALAKAWIKISVDKHVGDRQTRTGFWSRVLRHFQNLVPGTIRTKDQMNSKWGTMNPLVYAFNTYYIQAFNLNQSGCSEIQIFERAQLDFHMQYKKPFTHVQAWNVLKGQPKWLEQPALGSEVSTSSRKRKSSDLSNAPTPDSGFEVQLPCLNEDPNPPPPPRHSKGKKKSSDSSMRDHLAAYTTEKAAIMKAQLEIQKKKDEEYLKFIEREDLDRDMRFVMDPHDQIADPIFKEFVIQQKREICVKHGWPCGL